MTEKVIHVGLLGRLYQASRVFAAARERRLKVDIHLTLLPLRLNAGSQAPTFEGSDDYHALKRRHCHIVSTFVVANPTLDRVLSRSMGIIED